MGGPSLTQNDKKKKKKNTENHSLIFSNTLGFFLSICDPSGINFGTECRDPVKCFVKWLFKCYYPALFSDA